MKKIFLLKLILFLGVWLFIPFHAGYASFFNRIFFVRECNRIYAQFSNRLSRNKTSANLLDLKSLTDEDLRVILGIPNDAEPELLRNHKAEVVRKAYHFLAYQQVNAEDKAKLWERFVEIIQSFDNKFVNTKHQGSDGSFVFQGGNDGILLVIRPDGRVYRGNSVPALRPGEIWPAEYGNMMQQSPNF